MNIKSTVLLFVFTIFCQFSFEAIALSCKHFSDRIIAECENLKCNDFIYVIEIKSFGPCARRPVLVEPSRRTQLIAEKALSFIEYELKTGDFSKEKALYELIAPKNFLPKVNHFENFERILEKDKSKQRWPAKFKKLEETTLTSIEQQWRNKQSDKLLSDVFWVIIDWLSLIIPFVLLVYSIMWFNQWIGKAKSLRWLILSLSIQISILYCAFFMLSDWSVFKITILGLLIPGVWLYQIVFYLSKVFERKSI